MRRLRARPRCRLQGDDGQAAAEPSLVLADAVKLCALLGVLVRQAIAFALPESGATALDIGNGGMALCPVGREAAIVGRR